MKYGSSWKLFVAELILLLLALASVTTIIIQHRSVSTLANQNQIYFSYASSLSHLESSLRRIFSEVQEYVEKGFETDVFPQIESLQREFLYIRVETMGKESLPEFKEFEKKFDQFMGVLSQLVRERDGLTEENLKKEIHKAQSILLGRIIPSIEELRSMTRQEEQSIAAELRSSSYVLNSTFIIVVSLSIFGVFFVLLYIHGLVIKPIDQLSFFMSHYEESRKFPKLKIRGTKEVRILFEGIYQLTNKEAQAKPKVELKSSSIIYFGDEK